jgi:hemerythrin
MQKLNYPIPWNPEYSMQVKEIDEQHIHFVSLMNNLYQALEKMTLEQEAGSILKELAAYALAHFATEEKYFDLFNYEGSEAHKAEHRDLLGKVNLFAERFSKEGTVIVPELLDFLEDWLVHHLNNYDKKYVSCFKEHGLV